jgi:aldehyde dehydrogenase (NAD(P)+)
MDTARIDAEIERLQENKKVWARLPIPDKIDYLAKIRDRTAEVARPWVDAAVKVKGVPMDSPIAGEEWTSGPFAVLSLVNELEVSLRRLAAGVPLLEGYDRRTTPSGQVIVDVFPSSTEDRLVFSGFAAEVWMEPDVSLDALDDTVGGFYRSKDPDGTVRVVLAAGNIASIAPMDVIHSMFNEGRVVALKMNPVNDYMGEFMEAIFGDLAEDGFITFAYGGRDVGEYLTTHAGVDSIHITGHASTHDAIVYGEGGEGAANKVADRRMNQRPVESELGGVSPTIVVPGVWSRRDIRFQAEQIVSQKMHNSGFNCVSAQILVVPEGWEHTSLLLDEIRGLLSELDDRDPYYPGAMARCAAAIDRPHGVEVFGEDDPRYLITGLEAHDADEVMFTTEVFAPALGIVTLPSPDVPSYLIKAVRFANDRLYGTLGANILIDPRTAKRHRHALDKALRDLEYGSIAVNSWTGAAYFMPKCVWGGYPGHSPQDIQSGAGFVHNVLMFDRARKSVLYGPFAQGERAWMKGEFHVAPKPMYFVSNTQAHVIGERLIPFTVSRSKVDLAKVASAAIRG